MSTDTAGRVWAHLADGLQLREARIEIGAGSIQTLIKEQHQPQVALNAARDSGLLDDCQTLVVKDESRNHRWCRITDLSPLAGLTQLQELSIHCTEAPDITALSTLSSLRRLKLSHCSKIKDLSPILTLTALDELDLQGTTVAELPSLEPLTQLTRLNLYSSHLVTLDLANLPLLQTLCTKEQTSKTQQAPLWGGSLETIRLIALPALRSVQFAFCRQLRHAELSALDAVELISLESCQALQGLAIAGLAQLTTLDIRHCTALDAVSVTNAPALTRIEAALCASLSDLNGFSTLSGVTHMDLSRCTTLTSLDGIAGLEALHVLKLNGCTALTDISALAALPALQRLDLRGCTALEPGLQRYLMQRRRVESFQQALA